MAKGAVYHHFKTKEAVFAAVFDQVSRELVAEIDRAVRAEKDVLARDGRRHAALFCCLRQGSHRPDHPARRPGRARLGALARDRRAHFGGKIPRALSAAMDAGLIARQPVEPLARLLLGAVTEAAVACAGRSDSEGRQ